MDAKNLVLVDRGPKTTADDTLKNLQDDLEQATL